MKQWWMQARCKRQSRPDCSEQKTLALLFLLTGVAKPVDSFEQLRVEDVVGVPPGVRAATMVADGDEAMVDAGAPQAPGQTELQ